MRFIWATRGRTWDFRFLENGGFPDPLPVYEAAFASMSGEPEAWRVVDETVGLRFGVTGEMVALRFRDPLERRDRAGRVIPHEFVVIPSGTPDEVYFIDSVDAGRSIVWPLVEARFERIWRLPKAPAANE